MPVFPFSVWIHIIKSEKKRWSTSQLYFFFVCALVKCGGSNALVKGSNLNRVPLGYKAQWHQPVVLDLNIFIMINVAYVLAKKIIWLTNMYPCQLSDYYKYKINYVFVWIQFILLKIENSIAK